jgi:hypothetical protein
MEATNFDTIAYLQHGNPKQQAVYNTLVSSGVMDALELYAPLLVGTIPINIDIEDSDVDIICSFEDSSEFSGDLITMFHELDDFEVIEDVENDAITAHFVIDGFRFEIFAQDVPTKEQPAYKHMIIEHAILAKNGEAFRQEILNLKRQGLKTEPAFGVLLGLDKDPYEELLHYVL